MVFALRFVIVMVLSFGILEGFWENNNSERMSFRNEMLLLVGWVIYKNGVLVSLWLDGINLGRPHLMIDCFNCFAIEKVKWLHLGATRVKLVHQIINHGHTLLVHTALCKAYGLNPLSEIVTY